MRITHVGIRLMRYSNCLFLRVFPISYDLAPVTLVDKVKTNGQLLYRKFRCCVAVVISVNEGDGDTSDNV